MKRIRYLSLLLMLLCSITTWAQEFNPVSPAEPDQIPRYYKLTLVADPTEAASSLKGGGKYQAGTSVTLKTTAASGWKFVNWTDKDGNVVVSPYTTKAAAETLTARTAIMVIAKRVERSFFIVLLLKIKMINSAFRKVALLVYHTVVIMQEHFRIL